MLYLNVNIQFKNCVKQLSYNTTVSIMKIIQKYQRVVDIKNIKKYKE